MNCCRIFTAITLLLMYLDQAESRDELTVTVVEGESTNVNIICDLYRETGTLLWRIDGSVYYSDSVPQVFRAFGHAALTIESVDRRMDGWEFQCVVVTKDSTVKYGQITVLRVLFDAIGLERHTDITSPSPRGTVRIIYQDLIHRNKSTTFRWSYKEDDPGSPCHATNYEVGVFDIAEVDSQHDPLLIETFYPNNASTISISAYYNHPQYYFRIFPFNSSHSPCRALLQYHNFLYNENDVISEYATDEGSASFQVPANLTNSRMVWSKGETECHCTIRFLSMCDCNFMTSSNTLVMSNTTVIVQNLNLTTEMDHLVIFFIDVRSGTCHGQQQDCSFTSIERVYRIIIQGPPTPKISITMNELCFNASFNPGHPARYDVNVTDITGYLTSVSGQYDSSHCLSLSSVLQPASCTPLEIAVTASNDFGSSLPLTDYIRSDALNDNTNSGLCQCYKERDHFEILTKSVSSSSAELGITCSSGHGYGLTLVQSSNSSHPYIVVLLSCNSTEEVKSLAPSTKYSIIANFSAAQLTCELSNFKTSDPESLTSTVLTAVLTPVLVMLVVASICAVLLFVAFKHRRSKNPPQDNEMNNVYHLR